MVQTALMVWVSLTLAVILAGRTVYLYRWHHIHNGDLRGEDGRSIEDGSYNDMTGKVTFLYTDGTFGTGDLRSSGMGGSSSSNDISLNIGIIDISGVITNEGSYETVFFDKEDGFVIDNSGNSDQDLSANQIIVKTHG